MDLIYNFVITRGKKGYYDNELKRIKSNYPKSSLPIPYMSEDGITVLSTSDKDLYSHLCSIGFIESLDVYKKNIHKDIEIQKQLIEIRSKAGDISEFVGPKGGFLDNKFAKWLHEESGYHFLRIRQTDDVYYYKDGIYVKYGKVEIENIIHDKVDNECVIQIHHINEIISYIKRSTIVDIDIMQMHSERVACKNGVVDIRTMKLHPHSPENYMFTMIPWNYNTDAECPEFDELIDKLLPIELEKYKLNIMIGYPLINSYIYNKIFFLEGVPGSGKTSLINIIQKVYGEGNNSHITLHNLINRPFMSAGLIGSYANFSGDASDERIKDAAILKVLSGESWMDLDMKNVALPIKYKNTAKLIIDTNNMPEFQMNDDGIFRRIIQISFRDPIQESEKTSDYKVKYETKFEMEGILLKAVQAANIILTDDNPFKSTSIILTKEAYENTRINVIDHFISSHVQLYTDPDHIEDNFEVMSDVWTSFKDYCEIQNIGSDRRPGVNIFYKSFVLKCNSIKKGQKWISRLNTNKVVYYGMRLINIM